MSCGIVLALALFTQPEPTLDVLPAIDDAWSRLQADGDFEAAANAMGMQFDLVLAGVETTRRDQFWQAALAMRLVTHLGTLEHGTALELLAYLRSEQELAATVGMLLKPGEDPAPVYTLLDRLRRERGERVSEYASLAAAICVVHDRPLTRRINENRAAAPDPLHLFDFFVRFEKHMYYGVRKVPPELLVYVVDVTASIEELVWALERYAGDDTVGARFFDIEYDYDHFRKGKPKKVTQAGWSLPNIQRYGGVCADQAYYAMTVGKAIGVPTAYAVGRSSTVGHAWVGFLQARQRTAWWNFDVGRYEAYQGVMGVVRDPQINERIPDSYVSLQAELIGSSEADRQYTVAFTDAAKRLWAHAQGEGLPSLGIAEPVRTADVAATLDLVEHGLRLNPANTDAWTVVWSLARSGDLTLEHKKRWAAVLHRLCGQRYPDFYLAVLQPMIESIDDVNEQNAMWNEAFKLFRRRADLAARVRMTQGRMWEAAGKPARAGKCYEDVIQRYANAGPFIRRALADAERLLVDGGQGQRVLALYEQAFRSIKRPGDMAGPFYAQSNYYRVGVEYAKRLESAGRGNRATAVRRQIGG